MKWDNDKLNADEFIIVFEDMLRYSMRFLLLAEPDPQQFIEQFKRVALSGGFEFFNGIENDGKRGYACVMAIRIWNNTPLPSRHYRPAPLAKPGSHEPCFCGSGAQYKQCCMLSDQGRGDEAWACFQTVQRLNPDDPALSHLELSYSRSRRRAKLYDYPPGLTRCTTGTGEASGWRCE